MNKSSSFYSQAYYQKARKQAYKKKPVYRTKRQELLDQQNELEIKHYYYNTTQTCNMRAYFELLNEAFLQMNQQPVKKNQDYISCVDEFIKNMNNRITFFHQHLMSKRYLSRNEYIRLGISTAQQLRKYWLEQDALTTAGSVQMKDEQRVLTCNKCPLCIEQFEFNFGRSLQVVMKECEHWQQLNGHQKISKYRCHVQQNLRVLQHQLLTKCQYTRHNPIKIRNKSI